MSRSLLLMLCFVTGLLVLACGSPGTNKNGPANLSDARAASPAPTTAATTTASATQVGVAECDNFLNAYETCITTKVPEAARAQFQTTMTTWRTEWKKLAENPQTRAGLVNACKMQIEAARNSMKAYNCTF
jgi:hypothetical protein